MPSRRLEILWNEFAATVLTRAGVKESSTQWRETRRAFYGGAGSLLAMLMGSLGPGTEPTANDLVMMDEIAEELQAFRRELVEGRA